MSENWLPSLSIDPLLVSMHISQEGSALGIPVADFMLHPGLADYLKSRGPVGARDLATLRLLEKAEVPSCQQAEHENAALRERLESQEREAAAGRGWLGRVRR